MTSADTLQAHFKNEREVFLNILESIIILDIGTINYIDEKGRANVTSSTFVDSKPITYADAEIIYPGNANGCYMTACPGMTCLIFLPKSCMPNISDKRLRIGTTSYNRDGVKVMPIGNGSNNNVDTLFSGEGNFSIIGQEYNILFTEDCITLQREDDSTTISVDGTGQVYLTRHSNTGTYSVNIEDIGVTKTWLSQNRNVLWTDTLNPDGSRSFVQKNPNDSEADPLCSITIAADGTLTVGTAANISVSTTGNASVDADGDASVTADKIKLNGDSKKFVTYDELDNALQSLWTKIKGHTHTVSTTGTATAQTGTAAASSELSTASLDISGSATSTIVTGG